MYPGRSFMISKDSVTSVPPSVAGSNRYVHLVRSFDPTMAGTTNANSLPGSATITRGFVDHRMNLFRFEPLNRAPTAGPVAPPTHSHRTVSGLHSPIRVTSVTRS